ELFASSDEGKAFLLEHAQSGFSLKGEMVEGLDIQATTEGAASASGVDISFKLGEDIPNGASAYTTSTIEGGERKSDGGRLKTTFVTPRSYNGKNPYFNESLTEFTIRNVETIAHETLLHGSLHSIRYNLNYSTPSLKGNDHADNIFNKS